MKWTNKQHEFDGVFYKYKKYIDNNAGKIKLYCCGNVNYHYRIILDMLKNDINVVYIKKINDIEEYEDGFYIYDIGVEETDPRELPINTFSDFFCDKDAFISWKQMENHFCVGDVKQENFFNTIFPILYTYVYNKIILPSAQIFITPRCTLSCNGCCNGCNKWDKTNTSKDMDIDTFKTSIDYLFKHCDYVSKLSLIGGETFLHPNLIEFIEYIYSKYYNRLGILCIYTNNTIKLNEKYLKILKNPKTTLFISYYDVKEFYSSYEHNFKLFNYNNIKRFLCNYNHHKWYDWRIGNPKKRNNYEDIMTKCKNNNISGLIHTNIYKNKMFACCISGVYTIVTGAINYDYLDLSRDDIPKKEILEFTKYYSDKGYNSICKICNGDDAEYMPAGKQISTRKKRHAQNKYNNTSL